MRVVTDASDAVFARERQQQIAALIEERGRARVADLARRFAVSAVTIRKDLAILEGERRVVRTHGGAIAPSRTRAEEAFDVRERLRRREKESIGGAAASLVHDGESIALDSSTTALKLARSLKARGSWHALTIITNSLRIASELAGHPGLTVLMPGGRVRWEAMSVVGPLGAGIFRRVSIQKAFVGAVGFTLDGGLSDATEEEAQPKRSMVGAAREVIAIIDHTKWGRSAAAPFCRTDRLTAVIADTRAPADMVAGLREAGVEVILARSMSPDGPADHSAAGTAMSAPAGGPT